MMKKLKNIMILLSLLCSVWACEYDTLNTYSKKADVYFPYLRDNDKTNDMTQVNFFMMLGAVTDSTYAIPIKVTGGTAPVDRYASIEIVNDSTTAEEGTHYMIANKSVKIPAGAITGNVEIIAFRSHDLNIEEKKLKLKLVPNDDFGTDFSWELRNNFTDTVSLIDYTITFIDKLAKPSHWEQSRFGFYGTYSDKKVLLICDVSNLSPFQVLDINTDVFLIRNSAIMTAIYLEEQELLNNTIYEDDGSKMTMGAAAI